MRSNKFQKLIFVYQRRHLHMKALCQVEFPPSEKHRYWLRFYKHWTFDQWWTKEHRFGRTDFYIAFRNHGLPRLMGSSEVSQFKLSIRWITSKQPQEVAAQLLPEPFCAALCSLAPTAPCSCDAYLDSLKLLESTTSMESVMFFWISTHKT